MAEETITQPRTTQPVAHLPRHSVLADVPTRTHPRVEISASQPTAIFSIQGLNATGLPLQGVRHALLQVGPSRWMVVADEAVPQDLESAFRSFPESIMVTDISHAWCRLTLEGNGVRELLQSGIGLDLSSTLWPVGHSAPTAFREVQVVLHATGPDRFDLYTFRSVALCLWQWLDDGAAGL